MSTSRTVPQDHDARSRWITYTVVGLIVLALLIVMLVAFNTTTSAKAQDKAKQLDAAITAAGYPSPGVDAISRVLGADGGAVCDDPTSALKQGLFKASALVNGAAGPGMRPVQAAKLTVGGERLIIQTYCPDQLEDFDAFIASLSFSDVVKS